MIKISEDSVIVCGENGDLVLPRPQSDRYISTFGSTATNKVVDVFAMPVYMLSYTSGEEGVNRFFNYADDSQLNELYKEYHENKDISEIIVGYVMF